MASGLFTLKQQLQGLIQNAWTSVQPTYYGSFNGTSQSLTWPSGSSVAFGSGNFTFECWVYLAAAPAVNFVIDFRDASHTTAPCFLWGDVTSGILTWDTNGAGTTVVSATSATWVINTWYHIAYVRNGTVGTIYQNGIAVGTATDATNYSVTPTTSSIAARYASSFYYFQGYISNLRIVKGTALYTANFGVPNAPLTAVSGTQLLTLQNATIVDNSTNAYTITNNGSVTTTQTNQTTISGTIFGNAQKTPAVEYLVVAGGGSGGDNAGGGGGAGGLLQGITNISTGSSITVTVGAGGTVTSGINIPGNVGQNSVFGSITAIGGGGGRTGDGSGTNTAGGSGAGGGGILGGDQGGSGVFGQGNRGGSGQLISGQNRAGGGGGGAGTAGLNGTSGAPAICGNGGAGIASSISGTVTTYAGGGGGGGNTINTYSTPGTGGVGGGGAGGNSSTNPVAGTANTGGGGGSGNYNDSRPSAAGGSGIVILSYPDTYNAPSALTGTYTASTTGSGSVYFPGSAYFSYPTQSTFAMGTGDFTIECWFYKNSGTNNGLFQISTVSGGINASYTNTLILDIEGATGRVGYAIANAGGTGTTTTSYSTWNHIAMVRISGVTKVYVNGIQDSGIGSITDTTNYTCSYLVIGTYYNTSQNWVGNISNFRIVKGVGVYTGAFTPPTAPLNSTQSSGTNIAAITGTQTSMLLSSVSGAYLTDSSASANTLNFSTGSLAWNQLSPFATGLGYKKRVYTWTASGSVTF
jgi:hypothetical protein